MTEAEKWVKEWNEAIRTHTNSTAPLVHLLHNQRNAGHRRDGITRFYRDGSVVYDIGDRPIEVFKSCEDLLMAHPSEKLVHKFINEAVHDRRSGEERRREK